MLCVRWRVLEGLRVLWEWFDIKGETYFEEASETQRASSINMVSDFTITEINYSIVGTPTNDYKNRTDGDNTFSKHLIIWDKLLVRYRMPK